MSLPPLSLDTPVERFSARHDALDPADRWYSDRIPLTAPGPGEQYAFQVDLDQCTGCKSCVAGCHSMNGLDPGESWRAVGLLVGEHAGQARMQTVPSGCHHCLEPACLAGCPTNAYEKDPVTGIVTHLDDQCFGCGYCELTCPYEVPKLNHRLGIVRKCDMCSGRLAAGEAPACVQACPTSAISITLVTKADVAVTTRTGGLVPGAPASHVTQPTTQYISTRPLPEDARSADHQGDGAGEQTGGGGAVEPGPGRGLAGTAGGHQREGERLSIDRDRRDIHLRADNLQVRFRLRFVPEIGPGLPPLFLPQHDAGFDDAHILVGFAEIRREGECLDQCAADREVSRLV